MDATITQLFNEYYTENKSHNQKKRIKGKIRKEIERSLGDVGINSYFSKSDMSAIVSELDTLRKKGVNIPSHLQDKDSRYFIGLANEHNQEVEDARLREFGHILAEEDIQTIDDMIIPGSSKYYAEDGAKTERYQRKKQKRSVQRPCKKLTDKAIQKTIHVLESGKKLSKSDILKVKELAKHGVDIPDKTLIKAGLDRKRIYGKFDHEFVDSLIKNEKNNYEKVSNGIKSAIIGASSDNKGSVIVEAQYSIGDLLQINPRRYYELSELNKLPELKHEFSNSPVRGYIGLAKAAWYISHKRKHSELEKEYKGSLIKEMNNYLKGVLGEEEVRFEFYKENGKLEGTLDFVNGKKAILSRNDFTMETERVDMYVTNPEKGDYSLRFELEDYGEFSKTIEVVPMEGVVIKPRAFGKSVDETIRQIEERQNIKTRYGQNKHTTYREGKQMNNKDPQLKIESKPHKDVVSPLINKAVM